VEEGKVRERSGDVYVDVDYCVVLAMGGTRVGGRGGGRGGSGERTCRNETVLLVAAMSEAKGARAKRVREGLLVVRVDGMCEGEERSEERSDELNVPDGQYAVASLQPPLV